MIKLLRYSTGQYFVALNRLSGWFERQRRVLPWRDKPTLYRVWISEIMLQQTQVVTVIPYFERFVARFPDVKTLAAASEEDVMRLWAGLGYYSRARNLHKTAKIIAEKGFPKTRDGWLAMPGVGNYTAGAILSIALNKPEAILDGNVERVLSRIRLVSDKKRLWKLSRAFIRTANHRKLDPSQMNQALMELGATVCTPQKPRCSGCPFFEICRACANGEQETFKLKKKTTPWIAIHEELHCLIDNDGKVLLRERNAGEWRAGLWDLPEKDIIHPVLEASDHVHDLIALGSVKTQHIVTRHKILRTTHVWKTGSQPNVKLEAPKWVSIHSPEVPVGSALKKTLKTIREKFPLDEPKN